VTRQRLIGGVIGAAFAVLLLFAFAYLNSGFGMALWWRETSGLLWAALGLAVTGILIGSLARFGSGYSMLAVVPAVILGLGYAAFRDPLSRFGLLGFDPPGLLASSLVAVGALAAISLWMHRNATHSPEHEPRWAKTRPVRLLVGGALLTLVFLAVLGRLQSFFRNTSLPEWASAGWQALGFILLGGLFTAVFLVTRRTRLLNLGALVMLCLVFLAHPMFVGEASQWSSRLLVFAREAQIAMMSPVLPLMAGVLTGILASQIPLSKGAHRVEPGDQRPTVGLRG
jgi:hypothetical protein